MVRLVFSNPSLSLNLCSDRVWVRPRTQVGVQELEPEHDLGLSLSSHASMTLTCTCQARLQLQSQQQLPALLRGRGICVRAHIVQKAPRAHALGQTRMHTLCGVREPWPLHIRAAHTQKQTCTCCTIPGEVNQS